MPRLEVPRVVVILALLFLLAPPAAAQTTTSTIEGTVTDTSGAVIPGAEVTVRGATAAAERSTTTDAKGVYRLTALPAGTYTITVAFTGLATRAATLEVTLNRVVTFDVTLQVGGVQETVAVSTPALDPSTSATGATITPREIAELPVNGRNYLDLLQLVPGVAINRQVDPDNDRVQPGAGRAQRQQQFPARRPVEQGHRQRRARAAVQPGDHRRVPGADQRLQGRVRAGLRRDRQRHHQERRQPLQRRRFGVPQGRCARCVELAGHDEDRAAAAAPLRLEPRARRSAASKTRCSSSARRSTSARAASWISSIRTPETPWSTSCCASRKRRTTCRRSSRRRGRSSSSTNASGSTS